MYNDDYPTCARTYATLIVYPEAMDPAEVTERLGIEPSRWQRRGETILLTGPPPTVAPLNGWFLSSQGQLESKDSRRHIDWILDRVAPKAEALRHLQEAGCRAVVSCCWCSQSGHGGPTLPPSQMKTLGELDIELWFDIYGPYEEADS